MTEKKMQLLNVGLVMPIAPIDGCSAEHWIDVKRIIKESLSTLPEYTCDPKIVSEGNSVGLIHKRIVEGLYTSDIVICDVSCKNPNVMFELGMRLAFDKPTVIIKDDQTDYSFDTGVIEHLQYPRDLRYKDIVEFKERLAEKVKDTYEDSLKDPNHSPFLKSFGTFKVASISESEVSSDQFIISTLQEIQNDINFIKLSNNTETHENTKRDKIIKTTRLEKMIINSLDKYALEMNLTPKEMGTVTLKILMDFVVKDLTDSGIPIPHEGAIFDGITKYFETTLR
ncbi:hypothetical protein M3201_18520 [Paenibacillus motobuensis]|uniref:hypothetical protein n=1 Tax=Paenibacillus TaxID=44249 RepID=UPI00203C844B|nr:MULTISPECIES: hypothetical protein [Paenibacillus]MCM3041692.1 hypothetical protein [Paenibacillus lutimineralis]MCM3648796.1 hypothetical protein [Paenibacillus motobuensis]